MTQQLYSCMVVDERELSTHWQIASTVQAMIRAVGRGAEGFPEGLDWAHAKVHADYYPGDEHVGPHNRLVLTVLTKDGV